MLISTLIKVYLRDSFIKTPQSVMYSGYHQALGGKQFLKISEVFSMVGPNSKHDTYQAGVKDSHAVTRELLKAAPVQ